MVVLVSSPRLPVSFGNQFLHLRVGEAVRQGNEPEIPGDHLAGDRLDLAPGRLELARRALNCSVATPVSAYKAVRSPGRSVSIRSHSPSKIAMPLSTTWSGSTRRCTCPAETGELLPAGSGQASGPPTKVGWTRRSDSAPSDRRPGPHRGRLARPVPGELGVAQDRISILASCLGIWCGGRADGHDRTVECKGYNGTIVVDGDHLVITHSGFSARVAGLTVNQPRRIPLEAVSGVRLRQPGVFRQGWLTVTVDGQPAPELNAKEAGSNADTVTFGRESRTRFQALHDLLATVVERNQGAEVAPPTDTSVLFPDSTPGHSRAEHGSVQAEDDSAEDTTSRRSRPTGILRLPGDGNQVVVGEHFYQRALREICRGHKVPRAGDAGSWDNSMSVAARLVAEHDNPHDRNAVRVDVRGKTVGHLPREDAATWHDPLAGAQAKGKIVECEGRIVIAGNGEYSIYLHLSHPALGAFALRLGEDEVFMGGPWTAQVTREEEHQGFLRQLVPVPRGEQDIPATLAFCTVKRGKYAGRRAVEVRVADQRVGELSRIMSDRYADRVEEILASGKVPACPAVLKATDTRGIQVTVYLPRANAVAE